MREEIEAISIKSREDARKLGPFCNSEREMYYWVNWGTKHDGKKIRPYFRRYSDKDRSFIHIRKILDDEIEIVNKYKQNSIHKKVQDVLMEALTKLIDEGKTIDWYFKDERLTDFTLSGNLLSDVTHASKEYRIKPPFVDHYSLDIALLGPKVHSKNIILGAIEIEHTHEVDMLKTLLCKALGFPLLTFNISDASIDDITEEWCINRLTETRLDSDNGRRRNYVYLHNMLYPVYLSGYEAWGLGEKHQYVIFPKEHDIDNLFKYINTLKLSLSLNDDDVKVMPVNINNNDKGSITQFENEGALAGDNWRSYNSNKFIRLILRRPEGKSGSLYKFHIILTQLLTLHIDCLVGYKHDIGKSNFDRSKPIWEVKRRELNPNAPPQYIWPHKRFCPKRISEPINEILKYIPNVLIS